MKSQPLATLVNSLAYDLGCDPGPDPGPFRRGTWSSLGARGVNDDSLPNKHDIATMWGPRSIAKLVNITPMSLWFMDVYGTI